MKKILMEVGARFDELWLTRHVCPSCNCEFGLDFSSRLRSVTRFVPCPECDSLVPLP